MQETSAETTNQIEIALEQFMQEQGIDDLKKESQSVWTAALMYINRYAIPRACLVSADRTDYGNNIYTNCNKYDVCKIDMLCNYYIYMCYVYDKIISVQDFCKLSVMDPQTLYNWGNGGYGATQTGFEILQKLRAERSGSLVSRLVNKDGLNKVGVLAVVNHELNYAEPVRQIQEKRPDTLQLQDLDRLSLTDNN